MDLNSAEDNQTTAYNQFKQALKRAQSFGHLIFYNRKLISPYFVAARGFKLFMSRQGAEEAKCVDCGSSFELDPIIQTENMEVKDSFHQVISDHEYSCKFSSAHLTFNRDTVGRWGSLLFQQILSENLRRKSFSIYIEIGKQKIEGWLNKKQKDLFKQLVEQKEQRNIYIVSLMGWKITVEEIACQYCGQRSQKFQNISIYDSHRGYCLIKKQNYWESVLQSKVIAKLSQKDGQIQRTQCQVFGKNLRRDLQSISNGNIGKLRQLRYRIKGIKQNMVLSAQQDHEQLQHVQHGREAEGKKREDQRKKRGENEKEGDVSIEKNLRILNRIQCFSKQLEQYLRSGVKRIKID